MNSSKISRTEFLRLTGLSAAVLLPACLGGLSSCDDHETPGPAPTGVDFTLDVSTGALSSNGGSLVKDGIIVARTNSGDFIAVSAACTHEGAIIGFDAGANNFSCPRHGAQFSTTGAVTRGPANRNLVKYNTELSGNSLRVFS